MVFKVIQYATGITGSLALKTLSERDDMQLVGLGCTGTSKVGKDAGEITKSALTGIKATNDIDALCAMEAVFVRRSARAALVARDYTLPEQRCGSA